MSNNTTATTAADDAHKVRALVEELGDLIDDVSTWGPDDEARMLPKLHKIRAALTAALDADDRPWESLKKGDPLHVGDEVRQDWYGTTTTAIVGRVDGDGDPWTAEGAPIGSLDSGTWHVRRGGNGRWYPLWRLGYRARLSALPEDIIPGTWKVDDQ